MAYNGTCYVCGRIGHIIGRLESHDRWLSTVDIILYINNYRPVYEI